MYCFIGHVIRANIELDSDLISKGCGTLLFEKATEALNAVCILLCCTLKLRSEAGTSEKVWFNYTPGIIHQSKLMSALWSYFTMLNGILLDSKTLDWNQIAPFAEWNFCHSKEITSSPGYSKHWDFGKSLECIFRSFFCSVLSLFALLNKSNFISVGWWIICLV